MNDAAPSYKGYRFPPEIISYAVWLYYRFSLSFRDVEDLLAQRGVVGTVNLTDSDHPPAQDVVAQGRTDYRILGLVRAG